MAENDFDIRYVANLARITLSQEEETKLQERYKQLPRREKEKKKRNTKEKK